MNKLIRAQRHWNFEWFKNIFRLCVYIYMIYSQQVLANNDKGWEISLQKNADVDRGWRESTSNSPLYIPNYVAFLRICHCRGSLKGPKVCEEDNRNASQIYRNGWIKNLKISWYSATWNVKVLYYSISFTHC